MTTPTHNPDECQHCHGEGEYWTDGECHECFACRPRKSGLKPSSEAEEAYRKVQEALEDWDEREALALLPALKPQQAAGWQPIETAPRDGTLFLAYSHGRTFGGVGVIKWNANEMAWTGRGKYPLNKVPTHWMPLPTPPEGD